MRIRDIFGLSGSAMRAQSTRMRVIAENVANADSTGTTPGADPYRRKIPTVRSAFDRELGAEIAKLGKVDRDNSGFEMRFEPGHPAADKIGRAHV